MTKDEKLFRDVENFCKELRPVEDLCYLEHKHNDKLIPLARKFNILGMPVKNHGRNTGNIAYTKSLARIAMEGTGIRTFFSGHSSLGQKTVQRFANENQKKKYLLPSVKGKIIFAFALTEPEAGSNPLSLKMTYKEKNGEYVLNGVKYLISNAGIADAIITFARGPNKKISAFLVETNRKGIMREDMAAKMGMPTTNTAMFELKNYKIPKENLLGKKDHGWEIAKYALMNGRLSVAAGCVGVIEDCLIEAARFSKERIQHGKLIAKHQLIQEHIAIIKTYLESSRLIVERAAKLMDSFESSKEEKARQAADSAIAEAKLFCANAAWESADRAVQILGGRGWSFLYRPGRHLVDTRVCRIYEGTDEILKLKIASAFLGKNFEAYS